MFMDADNCSWKQHVPRADTWPEISSFWTSVYQVIPRFFMLTPPHGTSTITWPPLPPPLTTYYYSHCHYPTSTASTTQPPPLPTPYHHRYHFLASLDIHYPTTTATNVLPLSLPLPYHHRYQLLASLANTTLPPPLPPLPQHHRYRHSATFLPPPYRYQNHHRRRYHLPTTTEARKLVSWSRGRGRQRSYKRGRRTDTTWAGMRTILRGESMQRRLPWLPAFTSPFLSSLSSFFCLLFFLLLLLLFFF